MKQCIYSKYVLDVVYKTDLIHLIDRNPCGIPNRIKKEKGGLNQD